MLRWRLLSATIILALLLGLLYLDVRHAPVIQGQTAAGLWLLPLLLSMALLATAELVDLLAIQGIKPRSWTVYLGSLLVVAAASAPAAWPLSGSPYPADCPLGRAGWPLAALFAALVVVVVTEMRYYQEPGQSLARTSLAMFAITYTGLLSSYLIQLRLFHDPRWGMAALLSLLVVVKVSDTGAYAFGRLFGRHKIFPKLSPGKTWAGALGGLISAAVVSWLYARYLLPLLVDTAGMGWPGWQWPLYGLIVAAFGVVGDLTVSLLKRDVGRKDSGRWLPGLGGALDVVDSIFVAAPPAYFCWVLGLIGPQAAE